MADDIDMLLTPEKRSKMSYRTLTLGAVFDATPIRYKQRALSGRIKSMKRRISIETKEQLVLSIIYTTKDHAGNKKSNPEDYYQYIQQLEKGKKLWNSKCKVSCSCLDFLFTDEVSLFKRANADIYFSNGELPTIKNPKLKPQVCKHLIKLMIEVKKKGW